MADLLVDTNLEDIRLHFGLGHKGRSLAPAIQPRARRAV